MENNKFNKQTKPQFNKKVNGNVKPQNNNKFDLSTTLNSMAFVRPCFKVFKVEDLSTNSSIQFPQLMVVITKEHKLQPLIKNDPVLEQKLPFEFIGDAVKITSVKTYPDRNVMFIINNTFRLTCEPHVSVWNDGKYEVISIKKQKD